MTAQRDIDRVLSTFLEEGTTELPDRAYDVVRSEIDRTRQRVVIGPWRTPDMNTVAKFALAAAAVVVLAVVGINLIPRTGGNVGVASSPSPSPETTPTATPQASPSQAAFPPDGPLAIGRHTLKRGDVTFSVELTEAGWLSDQGFFFNKDVPIGPDWGSLLFWNPTIEGVYADPCTQKAKAKAGPSTADIAADVASLAGSKLVTAPSDVTVGGRPAKHVVITIPENAPCRAGDGGFHLWYGDLSQGESRYVSRLGDTMSLWFVDVGGTRLTIETEVAKDATPAVGQEIQKIIDSIQFE